MKKIQYAGTIFGKEEKEAVLKALEIGWLGPGRIAESFEIDFAKYIGMKYGIVVNSGSSANLLALAALDLPKNSEIITVACAFPTTVNPIIQLGFIPVFVDVEPGTYNVDLKRLEEAISSETGAVMLAHGLGNPIDMKKLMTIAEDYDLAIIEDVADALGSEIYGQKVGTFGIASTYSFYPSHHMTAGGGGGMILTNDLKIARKARSLRDWGRACYCCAFDTDKNGACGRRHEFVVDGVPYDHKFIYSNIGYSLKPTEMDCAFGRAQLKRLPGFVKKRRENFAYFYKLLQELKDYFILPRWHPKANPSWFCMPLTIRDNVSFTRKELVKFLENNQIQTRLMFAGNILRQPAYQKIACQVMGGLKNTDKVMKDTFLLGVWPGLEKKHIGIVFNKIKEFVKK